MNGDCSAGSIHFMTGDLDVVGRVRAAKPDYAYWASHVKGIPNLAVVGTAEYNDTAYYFMFLYAERAVWFVLGDTPYDSYWASETVWPAILRLYQLHNNVPDETFTIDYKEIH